MNLEAIMANPVLSGMVIAALAVFGGGVRRMYLAAVSAVERAFAEVAPSHTGDDEELVAKVRQHHGRNKVDSLMTTMVPGFVIEREVKKRKTEAPEG